MGDFPVPIDCRKKGLEENFEDAKMLLLTTCSCTAVATCLAAAITPYLLRVISLLIGVFLPAVFRPFGPFFGVVVLAS